MWEKSKYKGIDCEIKISDNEHIVKIGELKEFSANVDLSKIDLKHVRKPDFVEHVVKTACENDGRDLDTLNKKIIPILKKEQELKNKWNY